MKLGLRLAAVAMAFAGASMQLEASLLYSNGAPNQFSGNSMNDFLPADDFTLASASTVTDIRFWNLQLVAGDYLGSLYWAIYSSVAGAPGVVLFSGTQGVVTRTNTSNPVIGGITFSEFQNDFAIGGGVFLGSGTYWLALHDGALSSTAQGPPDFYWETTGTGAGVKSMEQDLVAGGGFFTNGAEHAFLINGTVAAPEPGTLALVSLGFVGLGLVLRKRFTGP